MRNRFNTIDMPSRARSELRSNLPRPHDSTLDRIMLDHAPPRDERICAVVWCIVDLDVSPVNEGAFLRYGSEHDR